MSGKEGSASHGAPIHQSLTQPLLIAGVSDRYMVLITTLWAALGFGTRWWLEALLGFFLSWGIGALLCRNDPWYFEALIRHLPYPDHFEP